MEFHWMVDHKLTKLLPKINAILDPGLQNDFGIVINPQKITTR
jgi:hypothetical protein